MGTDWLFVTLLKVTLIQGMAERYALGQTCTFTTHEDGLHADCSRRQLTSLPAAWPEDVVWLDLSDNLLSILTDLSHPHLAPLRHLDLSHNQLRDTLANHTFASLQYLRWLSLRRGNRLQKIQAGAMMGLGQLTFLDMSNNQLQLQPHTYPPAVFHSLTSLQELWISGNDNRHEGEYPEDLFLPLSQLAVLEIDTFIYSQFGPGFSALKHLKKLILNKNCKLKYFSNDTLIAFRNSSLVELHMTCPTMVKIETCALCYLPSLKRLYINEASVPLTSVMTVLYGLQHQDMDDIDLSGTHTLYTTDMDMNDMRYLRTICVRRLSFANTNIQRFRNNAAFLDNTSVARCLQEIDLSENRIVGDVMAIFVSLLYLKNLTSFRMDAQNINSVNQAGCLLGRNSSCTTKNGNYNLQSVNVPPAPNLRYLNISAGLRKMDKLPSRVNLTFVENLNTLDISYCLMSTCEITFFGLRKLETFDLSGNYCYNISDTIFDYCTSLKHLRLSNFNVNPEWFRTRAWRLFQKLELLETLDLSLNNLIHLDPHMLRAQRHLKELKLSGNRLQSMSVSVEVHENLQLLDLSHNMLPTLLAHERQALDTLAARHKFSLRLSANPLLCACSNLDFVQWLWSTHVQLDGGGSSARNFTCVTETGDVSDTASVKANYHEHWRHCNGQRLLGVASAAFLLQLLVLVIVYVVSRSWTHIRYVWKVMKHLRLPRREHFRWDAYMGYADADWELACLRLIECLEERRGVRLMLRDREELPGSIRAESILEHIDDSWKVLLLVTREFATDEWLSGFTVLQAQRSITDTMPDRVIIVFLEDPARLPPMASLERLLRMVSESHVLHVHRDTPPAHPVWDRLAKLILTDS